jgi:flagellar assembly protein FliH
LRNGSVLKKFIRPKVEAYQFPEDLQDETPLAPAKEDEDEDLRALFQDELFVDGKPRGEKPEGEEFDELDEESGEEGAAARLSFAKVQAEAIVAAAQEEAEKIKEQTAEKARIQAEKLMEDSRNEGYRQGYDEGMAGAAQELKHQREAQAARMEQQLQVFLQNISLTQDALVDAAKTDMRDLAIAVAEKVVRISLKSSSAVIAKMIQDATEKMKKREWVHIYVSGCDAKGLAQITPRLTRALSGLSDHIRIIPVAEEENGTCIIETPDAIIDASASTQMSNIRTMLDGISPDDNPVRGGRRM